VDVGVGPAITWPVHTEKYLSDLAAQGCSDLTDRTYRDRLRWFGEWLISVGCFPSDVTEDTARMWIVDQKARNLAPKTIHDNLSAIRAFYRWARKTKLILEDPLESMKPYKVPLRLPKIIPVDEVEQYLEAADSPRSRVIVELNYGCAIRTGGLFNLDVDHVDLGRQVLVIVRKGGDEQCIPMTPTAVEAVRAWLPVRLQVLGGGCRRAQAAELKAKGLSYRQIGAEMGIAPCIAAQYVTKWKAGQTSKPKTQALLVGQRGRLGPRGIRLVVKAVAADAGIQRRIYPHLFRHSAATHMLDNGADIRRIQQLLGHELLNTTTRYAHVAVEGLREVMKKTHPRGGLPASNSGDP
jgi:integrase/recombinase XerC